MKAKILTIDGKEKGSMDMPKYFSEKIREDIVAKVLEAKKIMQPYAPSLVAGKQHSAKGKMVHRRHVWRSGYGRGASRVPRKIFSQRGSNFNWEAAEVPHARGGMRAHPPKVIAMMNRLKINKKEMKIAFTSALSATANAEFISKKYSKLKDKEVKEVPFVVDSAVLKLKTKDLKATLEKVLENVKEVAFKKKQIRAGKGKARGRKYKSNAGALLVIGNKEEIKTKLIDVVNANKVGVEDLAKGGLGRIVVYTEKAIEDLKNKYKRVETK